MTRMYLPTLLLFTTALLQPAFAQDTDASATDADVWETIERQWSADENGDREWTDELLADNFFGWSYDNPVPRSKASTRNWDRFGEQLGRMIQHELFPYRIVVEGDMAFAHYFYSSAFKDKDGNIELNNGRFTDVLVRTEDGWKFIAWHGGDSD